MYIAHSISDYVIIDAHYANGFSNCTSQKNIREKLLLCQDNDELLLSLSIHNGIVSNLEMNGASLSLHKGNLEDFCLALEGISYFLYLIWNTSFERNVTKLEMELQAEIDKFVMLAKHMRQHHHYSTGMLRSLLFEAISYHEDLTENELQCYQAANKFADKYCWYLETKNYFKEALSNNCFESRDVSTV